MNRLDSSGPRLAARFVAAAALCAASLAVAVPGTIAPAMAGPDGAPALPAGASETQVALAWQASTTLATVGRAPALRSDELPSDWGAGNPPPSFDGGTSPTEVGDEPPSVGITPVRNRPGGFDGITELQQKLADDGHNAVGYLGASPSVCEGNGFVLETVQDAARVFTTDGAPLTRTVAIGQLLGDGEAEVSTGPLALGTYAHAHERCYFDAAMDRFMISTQRYSTDGGASIELAVSRTDDPRGSWDVYNLPVSGDGSDGAAAVPGCSCTPALLAIGADSNGIFLSTTLFGSSGTSSGFRVFAISKTQLVDRTATTAVAITEARPADGTPYPVGPTPAQTPPGATYAESHGGTEYLTAACGPMRGAVFVLAITNTASLADANPSLSLVQTKVETEATQGEAEAVVQREGDRPLARYVRRQWGPAPLEFILDAERCSGAEYADGRLWVSQATQVRTGRGPATAGVAWFQLVPDVGDGTLSVNVAKQGYLAVAGNSAITSSIAVDSTGHGAIAFELVGPDYFPSAAIAPIDESGAGPVRIVGRGQVPLDSFAGYEWFGSSDRTANADDFSTASVGADGRIWTAVSYQPRVDRELLTSWSTRITAVDARSGTPVATARTDEAPDAPTTFSSAVGPTVPFFVGHLDQDGRPSPYAYRMVGTDPRTSPSTTRVPAVIIPLRLTMPDGSVWDATSDADRAAASPLFSDAQFPSGKTQYGDAMMRAQLWSDGGSDPAYHVVLGDPDVHPAVDLVVPQGSGDVVTNPNGTHSAVVDRSWLQTQIHRIVSSAGISPRTLPIVIGHQTRTPSFKGEHGWWDTADGGRQTWIYGSWSDDPSPLPDAAVLSHEVAEWFADPFTDNIVPSWQSPLPGPASSYGCQRLLETGDPLVGATRIVDGYHLQDEALLPWFTREQPSSALNGAYTLFGTFSSVAPSC
ncbi:hypothetical protein [Nocardioides ultimimeridianus]